MKNFLLTLAVLLFCTATTRAINNPNYVIGFTQTYFGKLSKRLDQETRLRLLVEKTLSDSITAHTHNLNNPHKVTASLISLGNVNNTSDLSKPVSTATKDSLSALRQSIEAKIPVVPSALPPSGAAGGSLAGSYPNPTIATSVVLSGSPIVEKDLSIGGDFRLGMNSDAYSGSALFFDPGNRTFVSSDRPEHLIISAPAGLELKASAVNAPTPASSSNNSRVATTAFVKSVFAGVPSSLPPSGAAGGSLAGSYPNPTIATSVVLPGNPTVQGSLRLQNGNYGSKINFGDGEYVYLHEGTDDKLTIKGRNGIDLQGGSVTAPTPASSSNNTQVATTAFVKSAIPTFVYVYIKSDANASNLSISRQSGEFTGIRRLGSFPNRSAFMLSSTVDFTRAVFQISHFFEGGVATTTDGTFDLAPGVITGTSVGFWIPKCSVNYDVVISGWIIP